MSKVFLVKLESENESYKIAPPYGILYLASALEMAGFEVKLYHEMGSENNINRMIEDIKKSNPLFVGISAITGSSLLPSIMFSKKIKDISKDIIVVWGGLHPTMLPKQTLSNHYIDLIVIGEGENTIVELAKAISEKGLEREKLKEIKGIGYKENGIIRINPPRPFIKNLDDFYPAWHYLDIKRYLYKSKFFYSDFGSKLPGDRIATVITSRGCPWRCAYCYNQIVNKGSFRAHSPERVINDINWLKKEFNISAVVFEDDNFFTSKDRALKIIRNIDIPWSSSIRANYITQWGEAFIKELSENKCVELRIGAESGSQKILDIMQKDIKIEDIYNTVKLCQKYKINALFNFMIGIPGETWADMLKTFDLMDELEKLGDGVVVNGPSVYFPWPGTPLYDLAVERGFIPPERTEDWAVDWGINQPKIPYLDKKIKYIGYYRIIGYRKDFSALKFPIFAKFLSFIARKRWKKRFFSFPVDYHVPKFFLNLIRKSKFKKIAKFIYE